MKFFEMNTIAGESVMVNLANIAKVREFEQFVELSLVGGEKVYVMSGTFYPAMNAAGVEWLKYERKEEVEEVKEVEGELVD